MLGDKGTGQEIKQFLLAGAERREEIEALYVPLKGRIDQKGLYYDDRLSGKELYVFQSMLPTIVRYLCDENITFATDASNNMGFPAIVAEYLGLGYVEFIRKLASIGLIRLDHDESVYLDEDAKGHLLSDQDFGIGSTTLDQLIINNVQRYGNLSSSSFPNIREIFLWMYNNNSDYSIEDVKAWISAKRYPYRSEMQVESMLGELVMSSLISYSDPSNNYYKVLPMVYVALIRSYGMIPVKYSDYLE